MRMRITYQKKTRKFRTAKQALFNSLVLACLNAIAIRDARDYTTVRTSSLCVKLRRLMRCCAHSKKPGRNSIWKQIK